MNCFNRIVSGVTVFSSVTCMVEQLMGGFQKLQKIAIFEIFPVLEVNFNIANTCQIMA